MNPHLLATLGRERRRAVEADYARGKLFGSEPRITTARVLRTIGEAMFRLGVALDRRVPAPSVVETRNR
jgi:hypothetical protein